MTTIALEQIPVDSTITIAGPQTDEQINDPRWPKACACGHEFAESDPKQVFKERLYEELNDGGRIVTLDEAAPGAIYDATWMHTIPNWCGPDGKALHCKLPTDTNHWWHIDGSASNCTMPEDKVHRCWVRHGEAPELTIDKDGNTCAAGAGSIGADGYHGFLRNGYLED